MTIEFILNLLKAKFHSKICHYKDGYIGREMINEEDKQMLCE